jgi:hypothetical protein
MSPVPAFKNKESGQPVTRRRCGSLLGHTWDTLGHKEPSQVRARFRRPLRGRRSRFPKPVKSAGQFRRRWETSPVKGQESAGRDF